MEPKPTLANKAYIKIQKGLGGVGVGGGGGGKSKPTITNTSQYSPPVEPNDHKPRELWRIFSHLTYRNSIDVNNLPQFQQHQLFKA